VSKKLRFLLHGSVQSSPSEHWLAPQSLELLHCPSNKILVDAVRVQLGAIEGSVVVDPAPHLRIELLRESGEVRAAATVEVPVPNLLDSCVASFPPLAIHP
jgi:hypothetical protein